MSVPFSQTTRALAADRFLHPAWTMALASLLLAAWGGWLLRARVAVYVVTETARLEVAAHAVEAPLAGRVATVNVALGQEVGADAVLLTFDTGAERLALVEAQSRQAALEARLEALRREQATGGEALLQADGAGGAALAEAEAHYEEAAAAARLAEAEAARLRQLFEQQIVGQAEYERAAAEADQRRAAVGALRQTRRRLDFSRKQEAGDRRVRLDQLAGEIARLEGDLATTLATVARLEHEIARRQVRSPVAGRVGELATLTAGAYVRAGERLGAIVPPGALRAVAHLAAADALGRVRPGQPARLRLDGFSWSQYGSVAATVERVATEAADGRVRVELSVEPASAPRIPLQHGLPGTLEIRVERATPAALALRHAGRLLAS